MLIGKLAVLSGFSRDTIRYYEKLKLISAVPASGSKNNYKNYSQQTLDDLARIFELKSLGFTLSEIAALLKAFNTSDARCIALPEVLRAKISMFDQKIELLNQYRHKLKNVQKACTGDCDDGVVLPSCFSASK